MAGPEYRVLLTPAAQRGLDRLPSGAAFAVAEFVVGDLARAPRRVGKAMRDDFEGVWSARRGAYRVLYEIDDDVGLVSVVRIDHRSHVYRSR